MIKKDPLIRYTHRKKEHLTDVEYWTYFLLDFLEIVL